MLGNILSTCITCCKYHKILRKVLHYLYFTSEKIERHVLHSKASQQEQELGSEPGLQDLRDSSPNYSVRTGSHITNAVDCY